MEDMNEDVYFLHCGKCRVTFKNVSTVIYALGIAVAQRN